MADSGFVVCRCCICSDPQEKFHVKIVYEGNFFLFRLKRREKLTGMCKEVPLTESTSFCVICVWKLSCGDGCGVGGLQTVRVFSAQICEKGIFAGGSSCFAKR
jgi:hypothetical protein